MAAKTRRLSSGTISFDTNVSFVDDVVKVTTTDLTTKDRLITLNKGGSLGSDTSGIEIESGGSIVATIGYTDSEWEEMLKTHTDEQVMNKLFIWLSLNNRIKFEI